LDLRHRIYRPFGIPYRCFTVSGALFMNAHSTTLLAIYSIVLVACAVPLGRYIYNVLEKGLSGIPAQIERAIYKASGTNLTHEMSWSEYSIAVLMFNLLGLISVYLLQRLQHGLPLNPQAFDNVSADSAFNTAVSFVTNTDWQGYAGESTLSYLTQMLGLGVQNFFSAATGIVIAIALIRGFARHTATGIGNAWIDLTRTVLWILLPLSVIYSFFLLQQGSIQNFEPYKVVTTLEVTHFDNPSLDANGQPMKDENGQPVTTKTDTQNQTLPMGPVASQEAIKILGTNGGGFYNANSAHPYENPTPLSNFKQMLSIFLIPAALFFTFGHMIGDRRQGWTLFTAVLIIFIVNAAILMHFESQANPTLSNLGVDTSLGNYEGKETRFGVADSSLFATITTLASCGAVNAMHDSLMPLSGLMTMWNMMLGEVVFGGVGSGLYGLLIFAVLAVFLAGLMIGRTPEYLGKKIEAFDMKMVSIAILITPIVALAGAAASVLIPQGTDGIANPGAHGFSEILYAFTSAANNNGSAFAGLSVNTPYYNVILGIVMWLGRFGVIVPTLALAGSLAHKKRCSETVGTMPTHGALFVGLLIFTIILVGALNYVPALALGPVAEHLNLFMTH
jgi:K+-transporting ATPase ATPase A chain